MTATVLVVSGTSTDVGKTVVTAGIAGLAARAGQRVAVLKPGQTGVGENDIGDIDEVARLSGVSSVFEMARYPAAVAPATAARISGRTGLACSEICARVERLQADHDLVIVEGAGGLLVDYNADRETIADVARALAAPVLTVVLANLGTLNHTALTLEALAQRGITSAGIVIGRWPEEPDVVCRNNIADLQTVAGQPLSGAIRDRAGALSRSEFLAAADAGLAPDLGGHFDPAAFQATYGYGGPDDQ